ncbi:MAG: recombinase family protein, partial [Clostridiales bacterium]|nr:recombinase family protein [Clostridiales bacterium]
MPDILKQKVAIYIRVSTAMQIDKDSLQVQRRELIAYANMVLSIDDYEVFEDPGFSAKNTDRPAYQVMMARLRTGEFSHLLVWKIDRISRNLLDFTAMYSELKDLGVTFISKNERFDTSSAIGEAMLKIILVFAELERQMTAERVTAVMLSRANNGQWNGGRIPYGYDYDKQTKLFSINQDEAKVILLAYDLYEEKQSILYVSRHFNEIGLKTRAGNSWSATTVYGLLTNKFSTGTYVYNSHRRGRVRGESDETEWIKIENHHPAIIDDVRYDRMQYVLQRNRRGVSKQGDSYVKKNVHIFGGLCRCGLCGGNMAANLDRRRANGWRPSQYSCVNRRNDTAKC